MGLLVKRFEKLIWYVKMCFIGEQAKQARHLYRLHNQDSVVFIYFYFAYLYGTCDPFFSPTPPIT